MDWVVIENLLFAMIRSGTPLLLCGMGVVIAERAGVLNLGQEGMMLMGAVVAFIVGFNTESMFLGVLCGMASGVLSSLLFAVLSLTLQANQVAAGLALSIFGTGLAAFVGAEYVGQSVSGLGAIEIPLLSDIPLIGRALFAQDALIYLSLGMFVLIWFALNRWRMGLTIRAGGRKP